MPKKKKEIIDIKKKDNTLSSKTELVDIQITKFKKGTSYKLIYK